MEDIFCLTFELIWMEMGEDRRLDLIPDGANIPAQNDNREEYMRYVRWALVDIQPQWNSFQTGVMRVVEDFSLYLILLEEVSEVCFDVLN